MTYMTHAYIFQVMQPQSGSSSVIHSPNKDMKDRRVLGTVIFNLWDWNFKNMYIRSFITHVHSFQVMKPQSSVLNSPNPISNIQKNVKWQSCRP